MTTITKDIISGLSITELKQMLARVNHDLKMNKPTLKRAKKNIAITESEGVLCNKISATFTGKQYNKPVNNAKIIADIQIQKDILEFINNGGMIKQRVSRKIIKPLVIQSNVVSL